MDQGKLSEYTNWKEKLDLHMDPIDLRVASVREARNAERRFCFEVITPQFTRVYQAPSEEGMRSWIHAINSALQSAVEGRQAASGPVTESLPGSTRRDIASVLTGKSTSLSHRTGHPPGQGKAPSRHATDGKAQHHAAINASSDKLLKQVREADAGNTVCADCDSDSKVDWVSINLGIVLCIECSGIHRSLGTHISKVRSLTLDTTSFTQDTIEILLTIGNRVSNMIWEARLDRSPNSPTPKPTPTSSREARLRFITLKYSERAFVQPISSTLSHYSSADETLLASIKKNDIQNVLYALALRANPNAADRSRHTHPVHLALAASDPASPNPSVSSPPAHQTRKPFTVAELLLLNGADLPSQPPPFPLSPAAKAYLEQKTEQRNGRRIGGDGSSDGRPPPIPQQAGYTNEGLTALPNVANTPPSSAGIPMTGFGPNGPEGVGVSRREKEKDGKLQKRVSTGSRLMKPTSGL
jgi:Arf-GAP with SH3 domain, ANK repeat and PH domain-containing protein